MKTILWNFLTENNFEGKTIVPFVAHGGGEKFSITEDMGKLAKGARVLKTFVVANRSDSGAQEKIDEWLKNLR